MRVLAIETSGEACSVALIDKSAQPIPVALGHDHRLLSRGHAEALVPMLAALPDKGRANCIHVSLGPGSFTGVRIGIATARALGLAWQSDVLGYSTMSLLAQMNTNRGSLLPGSMENPDPPDILVCVQAGHGEWFVQPFSAARHPLANVRSVRPEVAIAEFDQAIIVGSTANDFVALRGWGAAEPIVPHALSAAFLPQCDLTTDLSPIYGRAPDARPPEVVV